MSQSFTLPAADLNRMLESVIPAASTDKCYPGLNAVWFEPQPGEVWVTTADRYVMARARTVLPDSVGGTPFALPLADAKELAKFAKTAKHLPVTIDHGCDDTDPITVSTATGMLTFRREVTELPRGIASILAGALVVSPLPTPGEFMLDAKKLGQFTKASTLTKEHLELRLHGEGKPIGVAIGTDFVGVIMPVRMADGPRDTSWATSTPAPTLSPDDPAPRR